ncbi:hypothetical protein JAB6_21770 [Janthinobacterium sp. HH104]|nr:hypothetical protein JAB6_21770 [Janthinobacterium sp. HH104]
MVRDGSEYPFNCGADLMFIYILPEFQGGGIGQKLVEQVKKHFNFRVPIELTCETSRRREFFERSDFIVAKYHQDYDMYHMKWIPE